MKIQKIVHSSVLVEESGVKIIFDPGVFSGALESVDNIDFIIITHKHADHLKLELIKKLLAKNHSAKIITNSDVGAELDAAGLAYELVDGGKSYDMDGVLLEAFGSKHEPIYPGVEEVENTGYLVAGKFYHPGDAYHAIDRPVEVLGLPLSAPWGTIGQSLDFARAVKPKQCFSVHDGMLKVRGPYDALPKSILGEYGIKYLDPSEAENFEI